MAPTRSIRKKAASAKPVAGRGLPSTKTSLRDNDLRLKKEDKRLIKHASFVNKIEKSSSKSTKRRRASKKLVANLESLADALPETELEMNGPSNQVNVIKQQTLKHKPGAMKRKEKMEKAERERFAKNMAQMSSIQTSAAPSMEPEAGVNSVSSRWAALRGFISQTMEQQPVFRANS